MNERPSTSTGEILRVPLPCLDDAFSLKYGLQGGDGVLSGDNLRDLGRARLSLTGTLSGEGVSAERVLYSNREMLKNYSGAVGLYFRDWMKVAGAMERNRDRIFTSLRLSFPWTFVGSSSSSSSDRVVYNFCCVRFETIMIGLSYGICLMNYANLLREDDESLAETLERAYLVLRDACMREISEWIFRNEDSLPFEATQDGCGVLMRICCLKLQRIFMARRVAASVGRDTDRSVYVLIVNMFSWSFVQALIVRSVLDSRLKDDLKGITEWEHWSDRIVHYQIESLVYVFMYASRCKNYDQREEGARLLHCAVRSLDKVEERAKSRENKTIKERVASFWKFGGGSSDESDSDPVMKNLVMLREEAQAMIPKEFGTFDGKDGKNPWSSIDSDREMVFALKELENKSPDY